MISPAVCSTYTHTNEKLKGLAGRFRHSGYPSIALKKKGLRDLGEREIHEEEGYIKC